MKMMKSRNKSTKIHAKPQRQRQEIPMKKTLKNKEQFQEPIREEKTGPLQEMETAPPVVTSP